MNKIKVLNEEDIKKIINMELALNAVEKAYMQKNSNKGNVWPLVFYEYEHNIFDLDIRSGNLDDSSAYGLKLISYNENNPNNNMPKVFATSLICDSKSGKPLALLNAAPITSFRTGAAAGIGAKYLARKDSENLLVVGCGNIAIYSIAAVLITMPNIKNVYICNPKNHKSVLNKFENIKETVNNILEKSNHKVNVNFICEENIESAVKISDIIVTATPSEKAMIKSEWVKEGTHFSCMGACMEGKQEIDVNLFKNAVVYADDKGQCFKSGELQNAYKEKILNVIDGEIGELILNNTSGRTSDEEITIFDSTGLFIQDLATSIELLEKSKELNIGVEVEI